MNAKPALDGPNSPRQHPDAETLSLFVDGSLDEPARSVVVEHLADCEDCLELVAEVMREQQTTAAVVRTRHSWRWLVAAAAVLVAAVAALLLRDVLSRGSANDPALAELIASVGTAEALPARLTGGFVYAPPQGAMRSGLQADNLALIAAAGKLQREAEDRPTAETLRRWGAAALLMHRYDEAERALTAAASLQDGEAQVLSDVGAVYVARAEATGRADDWPRAVAMIERALLINPTLPEALFNRAKAITALNLRSEAIEAWGTYLLADSSSEWAAEARRQLARLTDPPAALRWPQDRELILAAAARSDRAAIIRLLPPYAQQLREWVEDRLLDEWGRAYSTGDRNAVVIQRQLRTISEALREYAGDSLLADTSAALDRDVEAGNRLRLARASSAFALYRAGREAYEATKVGEAASLFRQADQQFADSGLAMRLWSQLYLVIGDYYTGRLAEAHEAANDLAATATSHSYYALAGRAYWMVGLTDTMRARHDVQLGAYTLALSQFERVRESSNIAAVHSLLAAASQNVGDRRQTWIHLREALTDSGPLTPPRRRHTNLVNVATRSLRWGYPELALIATAEALEHAQEWGAPEGRLEAHLYRARAYAAVGDARRSIDEAAAARSQLGQLGDEMIRSRFQAELDAMDAEVYATVDTARALSAGRNAIEFFARRSAPLRVPRLRLLEARALRRMGDLAGAQLALTSGIETFERERQFVPRKTTTRVSHIDDAWELYRQLSEVTIARGEPDAQLLNAAERGRARSLAEQTAATDVRDWTRHLLNRLPPTHAVVYYIRADDGFLALVLARGAIHRRTLNASPATLERQANELDLALTTTASGGEWKARARVLHDALIRPLQLTEYGADAVTFVPDGPIARVPFPALIDAATGRALIEDFEIGVAPSATFLGVALERSGQFDQSSPLLSVANSMAVEAEGLQALPGAAQEVKGIARMFPNARILIDRDATLDNVRERLPGAAIFHFAGHTVANLEYPELSRILLSDGGTGVMPVNAEDLRLLAVGKVRLVVLASCEGLSNSPSNSEAVLGIARGFLAAGVPNVVASRWKVADASTDRVMQHFYSELAGGAVPRTALAVAARRALHQQEPPRAWATWTYIGA